MISGDWRKSWTLCVPQRVVRSCQYLLVLLSGHSGVECQYRSGGQDSAELPAHDRVVRLHPLDKAFLRYLPCPVVSGHEGCKGGKNQMGAYLDSPFRRCCPLLFQLVAAQPARTVNGTHRLLYTHSCRRLSLPACRRCMDLPPSQTGPYGRCVQQRERKFHAGNKAYRKRIFCKSADTVLLWQEVEQRLDQCREPFPCSIVLGTPGSGKSFAVVNSYIKQQIEKGYAAYIYDFKFPDLSTIAYNHLLNHLEGYKVPPKFYVINFDDPSRSHRCNPLNPKFMTDISDAYESSYSIMLNLNRSWAAKQGDFFVESPTILFAAIIWFLRVYKDGRYCTFPHAVEFLNKPYEQIFPIMSSYPELENYLSPFLDAWLAGAADQLMGQIASAKIPLSRMISPALYWVMSADEFSLDINNPDEPKILCIGNNPDRQAIYGAALGLYNSRIVKIVNKKAG